METQNEIGTQTRVHSAGALANFAAAIKENFALPADRLFSQRIVGSLKIVRRIFNAFGPKNRACGFLEVFRTIRRDRFRFVAHKRNASVEGTHFERSLLALEDVGYRSFQAAASDLAAMAARPLAALSALTLPPGFSPEELAQLTRGQAAAARSCRCPIVGGNVARSEKLTLTTSVLGVARHPLTRSGAREGSYEVREICHDAEPGRNRPPVVAARGC